MLSTKLKSPDPTRSARMPPIKLPLRVVEPPRELDEADDVPPLEYSDDDSPIKRVSLGDINRAYNVLAGLADQPFDGDAAHAILTVKRWAHPHFVSYVCSREKLLDKYATKVEEGKWSLPIGGHEVFAAALCELDAELVVLDSAVAGALSPRMFHRAQISPNSLEQLSIFC